MHALIITASVPTTSSPRARSISIWCYFDHDFIYEGAFYFDLGYFDPGHLGLHELPIHDRIGIHVFIFLRAYSTSVLYYGASAFLDFLLVAVPASTTPSSRACYTSSSRTCSAATVSSTSSSLLAYFGGIRDVTFGGLFYFRGGGWRLSILVPPIHVRIGCQDFIFEACSAAMSSATSSSKTCSAARTCSAAMVSATSSSRFVPPRCYPLLHYSCPHRLPRFHRR